MITSRSGSGAVQATLEIDGKDTGALYLTAAELEGLHRVMTAGADDSDIAFKIADVFDYHEPIDDDPWDHR